MEIRDAHERMATTTATLLFMAQPLHFPGESLRVPGPQ
jgi:hypothetical protein